MNQKATDLREQYDGKGINSYYDGGMINKEDIFLLIQSDEDFTLGGPTYMLQIFPDCENALAFIAYGLKASELSHTCIDDCGAITDSYDLTHFTGEFDDPEEREYFEEEEDRNWDPKDVKEWIAEMDTFLISKSKFNQNDVNTLVEKFNNGAFQFQITALGNIHDFLSSDFILEEMEDFMKGYLDSERKDKDHNHPFLLLRPLIETNCLNLENEKHLEIVSNTLDLFND